MDGCLVVDVIHSSVNTKHTARFACYKLIVSLQIHPHFSKSVFQMTELDDSIVLN